MPIADWFSARDSRRYTRLDDTAQASASADVADGVWVKCDGCKHTLYEGELADNSWVCPHCGHHFDLTAPQRIEMLADEGSFAEIDAGIEPRDPLGFVAAKPYAASLAGRAREVGPQRGCHHGPGDHRRGAGRLRRDGLPLHRRVDGLGRRREGHACVRARHGREAPDRARDRVRRRTHAGGHALAHADGQDQCRRPTARGCRARLRLGAHQSDVRRGDRVVRGARRRDCSPSPARASDSPARAWSSRRFVRSCPRGSRPPSRCCATA